MGLTDLKKELKKLDKDKLIDLVADLYKKNKFVKEFFDFYVNPDEKELFNKYRDKVFEAFYPKRGDNYKLKDGKQAISDFKKLGTSADSLADLMLFYVETGVIFTNDFGDIDEPFYNYPVESERAGGTTIRWQGAIGRLDILNTNAVIPPFKLNPNPLSSIVFKYRQRVFTISNNFKWWLTNK